MPANSTPGPEELCWTDWSPCTVSCVPQHAAYFARQWRKQIPCSRLEANYSLSVELALGAKGANDSCSENVTASFRPCDYTLPLCQIAPEFPKVEWNNLVYMRLLVLSLASLFVLIPTLIVCIKYRRHAHPFVWLNQHAASLRDLTERSETLRSAKIDLKTLTPGPPRTIPSSSEIKDQLLLAALVTTTRTTTTVTESKSKEERKGSKRNTEWSKVGKSIEANVEQKVVTPPAPRSPFGESVSAHEVFTTVNIEAAVTKKAVAVPVNNNNNNNNTINTTTSVDTRDKDEKTQESKTNEASIDENAAAKKTPKSVDNPQEMKSVTQDKSAQNDVAPQFEGALVKGDVGAGMEMEKIGGGGEKKGKLKEDERVEVTQGTPEKEGA